MTGPRPQVLALLQAAKEAPDEDVPRLVLADWLQEHGDAHDEARGELIRLQCEEGRLSEDDPRRAELAERCRVLFEEHAVAWLGPLRQLLPLLTPPFCVFRRGLLRLQVDGGKLFAKGADALSAEEAFAWVDSLVVSRGLTRPRVANLAENFLVANQVALDLNLRNSRGAVDGIGRVFGLPLLAHLTLRMDGYELPGRVLEAATPGPHLRHLRLSSLSHASPGQMSALASWPGLANLTSLTIDNTYDSGAWLPILLTSPHLVQLRSLALLHNQLHDAGAFILAEAQALNDLTELIIFDEYIHRAGAEALQNRFGDCLLLMRTRERL